MRRPLISIVVPTAGRPRFLEEAIVSALSSTYDNLEVVVVPNGADESWRRVESKFGSEYRVRFEPIKQQNGNAARNHGLFVARGDYVRFLDDDDCLFAEGASEQYAAVETTNWDICTGRVSFVDASGHVFSEYAPGRTADIVEDVLRQRHSTLPVGHLFRKAFLADARWDERRHYLQDVDWVHALLQRGEIRWRKIDAIVGAWRHHGGQRVSREYVSSSPAESRRMAAEIISKTISVLSEHHRMTPERRIAAAKALWDYAAEGFIHDPFFWNVIAMRARRLDPKSRPNDFFYHRGFWRHFNPVALEWMFLPPRVLWKRLKSLRRARA